RQPVVATPALPRFLRPGDAFDAGLIARIVEGPGGAGRALLSPDNLTVAGARGQNFAWIEKRPRRGDLRVAVPQPKTVRENATLRPAQRRDGRRCGADRPANPARPAAGALAPGRRPDARTDARPAAARRTGPAAIFLGGGDLGDRSGIGSADRRPRLPVRISL